MARGAINVTIDGKYDDSDINRAIRDLNRLKTDSGAAVGPMGSLKSAMLGLGAAALGMMTVGKVVDFFKDSAQAAVDDEKSVTALSQAMKNLGLSASTSGIERFIDQLSRAAGVADDELRPAFQKLVTATGDVAKSQKLLQLAMDISAGTGRDLASVSQALSRASLGNLSALTRLGVPLDANTVKSKNFAAAVEQLNSKFGGQAAAAAETYGGKLARLQVAAQEAQETIGYALLDALDKVGDGMGGTGGVNAVMQTMADKLANNITLVGDFIAELERLASWGQDQNNGESAWYSGIVDFLSSTGPELIDKFKTAIYHLKVGIEKGGKLDDFLAMEEATKNVDALRESANGFDVAQAKVYAGLAVGRQQIEQQKTAVESLDSAYKSLQSTLGRMKSLIDFHALLQGINDDLKGNRATLQGWGADATENKGKVVEAFQAATERAKLLAGTGKDAAEKFKKAYDGLGKQIVDQFVKDGFKRSDVLNFLNRNGLWTATVSSVFADVNANIIQTAMQVGFNGANALSAGFIRGLAAQASRMTAMAQAVIASGGEAGKLAQESLTSGFNVGKGFGGGFVGGIQSGASGAAGAGQSLADKAAEAAKARAQAMSDAAGEILQKWDEKIGRLKENLDKAKQMAADWATKMQANLLSGFDIGAAFKNSVDENGTVVAKDWVAAVHAQLDQLKWFGNVLNAIKAQGGSQALIDYLAAQGAEAGGKMGQALIDEGLIGEMSTSMADAQTEAAKVANSLVPAYLTAGVQQAQALYDGFTANFGKGGPARVALENFMDHLAKSLERDITITAHAVYQAAGISGARAMGGPVSAGGTYLVGEKGPELFTPSSAGSITPNSSLGGGNTYQITVQAGVGDPRQIGQQVVEYIRKFEKANGPVWASA